MKLGKSEIGRDLMRSEAGRDEGPLQARVEILPSKEHGAIFVFPDDTGPNPGRKTARGIRLMPAVRLVCSSEALIEKVEQEELVFEDVAATMWPHGQDDVDAFRPEVGFTPIFHEVEGLDRPMSLLRGTFVEFCIQNT